MEGASVEGEMGALVDVEDIAAGRGGADGAGSQAVLKIAVRMTPIARLWDLTIFLLPGLDLADGNLTVSTTQIGFSLRSLFPRGSFASGWRYAPRTIFVTKEKYRQFASRHDRNDTDTASVVRTAKARARQADRVLARSPKPFADQTMQRLTILHDCTSNLPSL